MIKYFLNGTECNPTNRREVNYVLDFSSRRNRDLELSVDALRFVAEDKELIDNWRGTYGNYVGMPLDIDYGGGTVVRYLLDFSDPATIFETNSCSVKLIRYRSTDNFFDNAEGLSFGLIDWQASDFTDIDYVIIPENTFSYYVALLLAEFSLAQELAKAVQEISEGISDLVKATTPVGVPPAPDWGAIIVAAIKLAARIAYALFIIIALVKLTTEILNILFPKIRQFQGAYLRTLVRKGCEKLGYTLESTMLDEIADVAILPVPLRAKDPTLFKELFQPLSLAYTNGHPSVRDSFSTFGQLLDFLETKLNAEIRVQPGDVVRIETEDYFEQLPSAIPAETFNNQESITDTQTINSDEIFKRLVITYAVDPSDLNTFDDSRKTLFETSSETLSSPGIDYELIKRLQSVDIPLARGTRKGSLTFGEKFAKVIAEAVDAFCGTGLVSKIEARKDVLQLSQQYFGVTKILRMSGTRLHSDQNAVLGADAIAARYWSSKYIENNQKLRKNQMPLALTKSEFFNIQANNYLTLNNGDTVKVKRVEWNDYEALAIIDFETREAAVNEQTIVINAG